MEELPLIVLLASYDPQTVLNSVDTRTVPVMALMTLCLGATFVYLVSAFRTGEGAPRLSGTAGRRRLLCDP